MLQRALLKLHRPHRKLRTCTLCLSQAFTCTSSMYLLLFDVLGYRPCSILVEYTSKSPHATSLPVPLLVHCNSFFSDPESKETSLYMPQAVGLAILYAHPHHLLYFYQGKNEAIMQVPITSRLNFAVCVQLCYSFLYP